jgi:hypothetical protein
MRKANNTESGQGGPCLTDAAQEAALDEPLAVARRYAAIRTDTSAIMAAHIPGGVMQILRAELTMPSHQETDHTNIGRA